LEKDILDIPMVITRTERSATLPFIELNGSGYIKIIGKAISPDMRKPFLSLFWGINKIVSPVVYITVDLEVASASTKRYLYILFRIINHHQPINEVNVFWFFDENDREEMLYLGELFKEQFPEFSFSFFGK